MDERQRDADAHGTTPSTGSLKRRGLIAGAAALVAGALATRARQEVAAQGEPLVVGNGVNAPGYQTATAMTWLAGQTGGATPALRVTNQTALVPTDAADGVQGYAAGANNAGLFGRNDQTNGEGVHGEATAGTGVFGYSSSGLGVTGQSVGSYGVYGVSGTTSANLYGVYAVGGSGVYGSPAYGSLTLASGAGIVGQTGTNYAHGVVGSVIAGVAAHAVVGSGTTANYAGVLGQTSTAGAYALYGFSGDAGAYAGYFSGKVTVAGDFAVTGSKSAAIAQPDGTHRLVYSVEAPEAWLEDFGEATLVNGRADVALDPAFAALIDARQMHVFLTARYAAGQGLAVTQQGAGGFTITEQNRGTGSGLCSWRVVARRKDQPGVRLASVTLPRPVAVVPEPPRPPGVRLPKRRIVP